MKKHIQLRFIIILRSDTEFVVDGKFLAAGNTVTELGKGLQA